MHSTRGKTRADRARAALPYGGRVTDAAHVTAPLHSNSPTHNPGNARPSIRAAAGMGSQNTNRRLKDGGISSYYRTRQGKGYGL
jgi:hypothetical protein